MQAASRKGQKASQDWSLSRCVNFTCYFRPVGVSCVAVFVGCVLYVGALVFFCVGVSFVVVLCWCLMVCYVLVC